MNKKELGLGIGAIALGIATLVYFLNIPPKSAFYPRMISIAIILLGLVITFNAVKAMKAAPVQPEQPAAKAQISYSSVSVCILLRISIHRIYHSHIFNDYSDLRHPGI